MALSSARRPAHRVPSRAVPAREVGRGHAGQRDHRAVHRAGDVDGGGVVLGGEPHRDARRAPHDRDVVGLDGRALTRCPRCGRTYNASDHVRAYQPGSMSILFDGFRLAECREFGHPYRVWGGFETFVRHRLLGMTLPYTGVYACPGCGPDESPRRASGKDASSGGVSLTRRTLKKAVAGLGRARPRWIIAVYSRNLPI